MNIKDCLDLGVVGLVIVLLWLACVLLSLLVAFTMIHWSFSYWGWL